MIWKFDENLKKASRTFIYIFAKNVLKKIEPFTGHIYENLHMNRGYQ